MSDCPNCNSPEQAEAPIARKELTILHKGDGEPIGLDGRSELMDWLYSQPHESVVRMEVFDGSLATQPTASNVESPSDDERWAAWVASMVGCYLGFDVDDKRNTAIAGIIQRRLWGLPGRATQPTASNAGEREAMLCDVRDKAASLLRHYEGRPKTADKLRELINETDREIDELRAALASKPPAGEQKPICYLNPIVIDPATGQLREGSTLTFSRNPCGQWQMAVYTAPQPEQVAQDSAVLAYLDDLKDDAIAHIWPDDLERCQTRECTVTVASVRLGSPNGHTLPLFSRKQVADALRAARARGESKS